MSFRIQLLVAFTTCFCVFSPPALANIAKGDLLVTDSINDRVLRIDPSTANYSVLSPASGAPTNYLNSPMGIAIASDGSIYVANAGDTHLIRINPLDGNQVIIGYLVAIPTPHSVPISIGNGAADMDIDSAGDLYVLAQDDSNVRKISNLGTLFPSSTELLSSPDPVLSNAWGITIDGSSLDIAAGTDGFYTLPKAGGTLSKFLAPQSSMNLVAIETLAAGSTLGLHRGANQISGYCTTANEGLYRATYHPPFLTIPSFWSWSPWFNNNASGLGSFSCPDSMAVGAGDVIYVGQTNGWFKSDASILKIETFPSVSPSILVTIPSLGTGVFPADIEISPITVPEPEMATLWMAAMLVLLTLTQTRSKFQRTVNFKRD